MIMNRNLRKTLDWIELPVTLVTFLKMNSEQRENAKSQMNNWSCEWRRNTVSFKIAQWFLNVL